MRLQGVHGTPINKCVNINLEEGVLNPFIWCTHDSIGVQLLITKIQPLEHLLFVFKKFNFEKTSLTVHFEMPIAYYRLSLNVHLPQFLSKQQIPVNICYFMID